MIYTKGDILRVNPLTGQCRSNVRNPYLVIVKSDDKDFLVTEIPLPNFHVRTFNKSLPEWRNGHSYRFEKVAHSSDPHWMKKVLTQTIE